MAFRAAVRRPHPPRDARDRRPVPCGARELGYEQEDMHVKKRPRCEVFRATGPS